MEHRVWSIEKRQLAEKKDGGRRRAFCQLSVVRCPLREKLRAMSRNTGLSCRVSFPDT